MRNESTYVYAFGPFRLNPTERLLLRDGKPVQLTPKALDLLVVLIENSGHVVTTEKLLSDIWPNSYVEEANVTQNIFTLRKTLGGRGKGRQYIETVPRRGYRFVATVRKVDAEHVSATTEKHHRAAAAEEKATDWQPPIHSLAVLPLVNANADPTVEYLSDGITESLINSLAKLPGRRVMSYSASLRYKDRGVDAQKAGRELRVDAVLTGRVLYQKDRLVVGVELIDVAGGWQLWGEVYNREPSDIFAVQEEISREILEKLEMRLTPRLKKLLTKRDTVNVEAYQAYLKGRYNWNKRTEEGFKMAMKYFRQTIKHDPHCALAYAGLADCYNLLDSYGALAPGKSVPRIKAALKTALEIDNALAEAHASLAHVLMIYEWNWAGAEQEFKRAIELNPNYATAHHWYSLYLKAMSRFDEALEEIKQAQLLDPFSLIINAAVGSHYYYARQYERAIAQCHEALELDPNFYVVYGVLGEAYTQKEMYKEAIAALQKALSLSKVPELIASLGYVYAVRGESDKAQSLLDELQSLSKQRYIDPAWIAIIHVGLRNKEEAFSWLEKAYRSRSQLLLMSRADPRLDTLRSDLRFARLLRQVGLK